MPIDDRLERELLAKAPRCCGGMLSVKTSLDVVPGRPIVGSVVCECGSVLVPPHVLPPRPPRPIGIVSGRRLR